MIIWITGQPGSGKTTLAKALVQRFEWTTSGTVFFDGDDLRKVSHNKDYSIEGRRRNVSFAQRLASEAQVSVVIVALVSPFRDQREEFKRRQLVLECYTHRESPTDKDIYRVEGYEPPLQNFVDLDTDKLSLVQCLDRIHEALNLSEK